MKSELVKLPTPQDDTDFSHRALLWLVTGGMMLQPLATDLYQASMPHLVTYFQTTLGAVQQTLTLFVLGFGSAQLISGPLSDRFGRRPTVLWGIAIFVGASIACALAPTLHWLVLARFIQAVGCCTGAVVTRAMVRDVYSPAEGAKVLARASSLFALTPILGPILGSYLQVQFGWRAAFVAHAAYGLLLFLAARHWLRETNVRLDSKATGGSRLLKNYGEVMVSPRFWAYGLPGALSYGSIFVFISGASHVLIRVLLVPTEYFGYCFAIGVVGYLSGTLICRYLLSRFGLVRTLGLGTLASAGGGLLFFMLTAMGQTHWAIFVVCMGGIMLAHGINFPCALAGAVAPFPEKAGAAAGLFGFFIMMTALLVGVWVATSQDGTVLPLAATSLCMGLAVFLSARALVRYRPVQ
ncbi:multidrug effflux MFS transporter [Denitratisoma oestradiolicum]|uniref:Bcr/CflA family efflux transporter n=1 Tax=Denitratisoma oestradiolicum TaxID=311182 RepID=A0A6S6Y7K3_9PROT|nr:multidrug effflux MFS transporter [Denitratisoma oestradiolicum]TWO79486.1 hypothetical protein CBW56_14515 [Denitratisoma oestradiolicum]CAB1368418.1 conserved membrane protein of unknown function [Denitratisoma oestradiolicum]